jgi:Lrp/AsnC family transcriptional regulator for asnA, asnC and gidA
MLSREEYVEQAYLYRILQQRLRENLTLQELLEQGKLENAGVISGSKFVVDTKVLGYSTMAFIGIYLEKASNNPEVVKELKKIPEVLECHYTTGNWSILIKLICRDNEHLMQLLNKKIQPIDGVSRTETYISLEQQIERQIQL